MDLEFRRCCYRCKKHKGDIDFPGEKCFEFNNLHFSGKLIQNYTFDRFVPIGGSRVAYQDSLDIAGNPGRGNNPLFIYGQNGNGETHLLHAIGHYVTENDLGSKVIVITAERFVNDLIYSLRFNKMICFRRKFRYCDLLLIDDIQFLSHKERSQEEFLHTIKSLLSENRQIVATSGMPPSEIPGLDKSIVDLFLGGLVTEVGTPKDSAENLQLIKNFSKNMSLNLQDEVMELIAKRSFGSIRRLQGFLSRIVLLADYLKIEITDDVLDKMIEGPYTGLSVEDK
ncbi:MAG: ATP-binding protein [Oligoflexales bacterium]|nr:ATP-binding protein [Oligoflexales bacterium]